MLTYQLHSRIFNIENNENLSFPNDVEIELKLSPPTSFGTDSSPSRTLVKAGGDVGGRATLLTNIDLGFRGDVTYL